MFGSKHGHEKLLEWCGCFSLVKFFTFVTCMCWVMWSYINFMIRTILQLLEREWNVDMWTICIIGICFRCVPDFSEKHNWGTWLVRFVVSFHEASEQWNFLPINSWSFWQGKDILQNWLEAGNWHFRYFLLEKVHKADLLPSREQDFFILRIRIIIYSNFSANKRKFH